MIHCHRHNLESSKRKRKRKKVICVIHVLTIHLNHSGDFHDHSNFKAIFFFLPPHCSHYKVFIFIFHCCCPQTAPGNYIKYFSVDFSSHTPSKAARGKWKSSSAEIPRVCRGHFLAVSLDVDVWKLHIPFVYIYIIFLHRKKTLQKP